ncbi:MAG: hypothetical protein HKO66_02375 [Saprospiraceae bacterium]|nr:hypothetical protein [Saprospiraceae bacterium]
MQQSLYINENDSKRNGFWISLLFHMVLLFLFLMPCFSYFNQEPPEQRQGVIIALGNPEAEAKTSPRKSEKPAVKTPKETTVAKKTESKPKSSKSTKKESPAKKVVSKTVVDEAEIAAVKKKEAARKKADEEAEKAKAAKLAEERKEAERKRKIEEERQRREEKARQKAEAKSKAKSKFSSLLGQGSENANESKGNENGKPDASALDGLSSGSGKVGDGLGERGVLHIPKIVDNTQKTGRVVVKICVDQSGKVISSKFTQKGSTTTDAHLIQVAEKNAKKYKFSKSKIEEQCGNIVIDFKLK